MKNNPYQGKKRSSYVMMALNLDHKKLLIVGGGPVAYKRFKQWQDRGAEIHVVAVDFCEDFEQIREQGSKVMCAGTHGRQDGTVLMHKREFSGQDLEGKWMVYAATRDEALNESIERQCRDKGILWGRGDVSHSEVQSVAMLESPSVQIGISASGKAPAMIAQIKEKIEGVLDLDEIEEQIDLMQKLKLRLKSEIPDQAQRALILRKAAKMSLKELEDLLMTESLLDLHKFFT